MPTPEELFHRALEITLGHEGGVSRDPKDTAGDGSGAPHTNLGITLKTVLALDADGDLPAYLRAQFDIDHDGDIDAADVPGWKHETAVEFYRLFYWGPTGCQALPFAIAVLLFDAAVNMGKGAAVRTLQRSLGVTADGVVGRATVAAARQRGGSDPFLGEMLAQRLDQCRTFKTANDHFLGWSRRCFSLHLEALKETV